MILLFHIGSPKAYLEIPFLDRFFFKLARIGLGNSQ